MDPPSSAPVPEGPQSAMGTPTRGPGVSPIHDRVSLVKTAPRGSAQPDSTAQEAGWLPAGGEYLSTYLQPSFGFDTSVSVPRNSRRLLNLHHAADSSPVLRRR